MKLDLDNIMKKYNVDRKLMKLKNNPSLFFEDFYKKKLNMVNNFRSMGNAEQSDEKTVNCALQRIAVAQEGTIFFERLKKICEEFKINYMQGATLDQWMSGMHIEKKDLSFFLKVLHEWLNGDDIYIALKNEIYTIDQFLKINTNNLKAFDILVKEIDGNSVKYCSYLHIMLWQTLDSYSSEKIYTILEENRYIHRLREETYKKMMKNHEHINTHNNIFDFNFPIDIVYTWVDGDDLNWKKEKNKFQGKVEELVENTAGRAVADERFRNRDELLYSLRSVELFAPFVRNIYIVTAGQIPKWLNLSNSKIKIIDHTAIYKNKDHLPTFNSNSIETQLHYIEGLSEYFLYLNDDFMFSDFCTPEDFFYSNGSLKFFPSEARAYIEDIDETREEYLIAEKNNHNYLFETYNTKFCQIMKHVPYPASKSLMRQIEKNFPQAFEQCSKNRFRSASDIRPFSLQYAVGYVENKAYPSSISHRYLALYKPTINRQFKGVLEKRNYKTICINDVGVAPENLEKINELTANFLENYFPIKSSFEK